MGEVIRVDFARRQLPEAAALPLWWWITGALCVAGFYVALTRKH